MNIPYLKPKTAENLTELPFHPCIHPRAHQSVARIHLPVAKDCNMWCRYCARQHANGRKGLPGTSTETMTPEQALIHVKEKREIWGEKAVIGISGPGEPLANPETFETLGLIKSHYPSHPLCLCTNGFLLNDKIQELFRLGIRVISITINGIDPEIVRILQPCIDLGDVALMGRTAATKIIEAQMSGLRMAIAAGIFVKVNTVLVEGINDGHMRVLARSLAEAGAGIMNIMPVASPHSRSRLIPPHKEKVEDLRRECEAYLPQFKLCRQCRSDSTGIPGQIRKGGCL